MKLSISIQASTKTTQITIPSENLIVVNGEDTDLSSIPNNGTADGVSPIIGQVSKDGAGINTLTVLMQYVPSSTKWNGQDLQELDITSFPAELSIEDFIVPEVTP